MANASQTMIRTFYHKSSAKSVDSGAEAGEGFDKRKEELDKSSVLWYHRRVKLRKSVEGRGTVLGKHSARRGRKKASFFKKHLLSLLLAGAVLLLAVCILLSVLPFLNPYKATLREAGVEVEEFHRKKGEISLTLEGDSLGILSCRRALNALRASEHDFDTVLWRLVKDGEEIQRGTVEHADTPVPTAGQRVETLAEDLTLLKLKYQLAQNGLSAEITAEETVGLTGKTVTVTVSAPRETLTKAATTVPAAIEAVNGQGGGIVRCDVLFTQEGGLYAAASYDFVYGDSLFSSAFREQEQ